MPKLLLFAPCEKAIISQDDRTMSLISVLEGVNATIPKDAELSSDEVYPKPWVVVSSWRRTPEDIDKKHEQLIQIILPDGQEALRAVSSLDMTTRDYRIIANIDGFVIGHPGDHIVRLSLREAGEANIWEPIAEYPLAITHSQVADPQNSIQ